MPDRVCIREFEFLPEYVLAEKNDKILRLSSLLKAVPAKQFQVAQSKYTLKGNQAVLRF